MELKINIERLLACTFVLCMLTSCFIKRSTIAVPAETHQVPSDIAALTAMNIVSAPSISPSTPEPIPVPLNQPLLPSAKENKSVVPEEQSDAWALDVQRKLDSLCNTGLFQSTQLGYTSSSDAPCMF